jgi:hypothetical protein
MTAGLLLVLCYVKQTLGFGDVNRKNTRQTKSAVSRIQTRDLREASPSHYFRANYSHVRYFIITSEFGNLYSLRTASVVQWSEFLATDPEARVRFPALPEKKKI